MFTRFFNRLRNYPPSPGIGRGAVGEGPPSPRIGGGAGGEGVSAFTISAPIDDSPGWGQLTGRPHEYDLARLQEIYSDALEAWRKNPIAWRTVAITTDYVTGDPFTINSPYRALDAFIQQFWNHPSNAMGTRIESMCDELSRAGDLFVLLFRNPVDGMSYIRFVTKDRITKIETAPNDWETELAYTELSDVPTNLEKVWLSPAHPDAPASDAIMLHYAINRPIGALLGESDLVTMLPWLLRYSRMLEDRVRLHWATRAFLWMVTVPANRVREKQEQYRVPPDPGSILVKDETETWDVQNPALHGVDARHDLQSIRAMIDAGSGYPPHWRGDAGDISLATAQAMQGPTERHLRRRQAYFLWMLQDILYHAYSRAAQIGKVRPLPRSTARAGARLYESLFTIHLPDLSRYDNESLARAASSASQTFAALTPLLPALPPSLAREVLRIVLNFIGEPVSEHLIDQILSEVGAPSPPAQFPGQQ